MFLYFLSLPSSPGYQRRPGWGRASPLLSRAAWWAGSPVFCSPLGWIGVAWSPHLCFPCREQCESVVSAGDNGNMLWRPWTGEAEGVPPPPHLEWSSV